MEGHKKYGKANFYGYCLDSGASHSVIGELQGRAHRKLTSHPAQIRLSKTVYRFASSTARSKGITNLRLPLPDGQVLNFYADIIESCNHLFLGLDVTKQHGLQLDFFANIITSGRYD